MAGSELERGRVWRPGKTAGMWWGVPSQQREYHDPDVLYLAVCGAVGFLRGRMSELAQLRAENDKLRALLANGSDPCVYCALSKADMGKCRSGFPGCGRADDMSCAPSAGEAPEDL